MFYRLFLVAVLLPRLLWCQPAASTDSLVKPAKKTRKIVFGATSGVVAVGSLSWLSVAWYKQDTTRGFHGFNDNSEWLQMDKCGHTFTTYQTARLMMESMAWAGFSPKQCKYIGGLSGFAYMTIVEVMDGFSPGYGFSWGDMGANASGSLLAIAQQHFWNEQRILVKFSFHQTSFPMYRKELLGENLSQQILKDYNGQTYWLSVSPAAFIKKESKFPKWISVAFGYGASGMISGTDNYVYVGADGKIIGNDRYRRFFLSLDLDLARIPVKSKFLKGFFSALNCFKIPFPALEWNGSKITGHPLYF